jgi:hypothetical protein
MLVTDAYFTYTGCRMQGERKMLTLVTDINTPTLVNSCDNRYRY